MSKSVIAALFLAGFSSLVSASPFFAPDADENSPQVVAFYQGRCNQWADENALQGAQRDAFVANCLTDIPQVWTVGMDNSDD